MSWLKQLKNMSWLDLGAGPSRHRTKGKLIAFNQARRFYRQGHQALDLGCGDGFWSEQLKSLGYQLTSVDQAKYYDGANVLNLENRLPFSDHSFDLIWSTEVLEHLWTPEKIILEIKRILKPDGYLILTTPNSHFWIYPILKLFGQTPQTLQNPDHKQFFHRSDIRRLFPRAQIYGFFPYFILKLTLSRPRLVGYLSPTFVIVAVAEEL